MSGTSQWPMSELNIALSRAPKGLSRGVEADRDQRVVGFAAEVEVWLEERAQVLGAGDAERVELVSDQLVFERVPSARPTQPGRIVRVRAGR